jgi:hypothetical protein
VLRLIFLAAVCVLVVFAITEQLWPALIAVISWLAIVLWFLWPDRDEATPTASRQPSPN